MTRIATKAYCNIVEAGGMDSGSFLGDLIACPTYQEINEIGKFNVTGTYENNQLVKESDISKYTGKTINYANVWGEWDLNGTNPNLTQECVWFKFHITFLNYPDVNTSFRINYKVNYTNNTSSATVLSTTGYTTISITNPTSKQGIYGGSISTSKNFGTKGTSIFKSIVITSVTATPSSTSNYVYTTFIKPVTQNNFNDLSLTSANFNTKNYIDNTTEKKEQCTNQINITFEYPTNITSDRVFINIEPESNFNGLGSIGEIYYNSQTGFFTYEFTAPDNYGERGYKLPYYTAKFKVATLLPSGDYSYYVYLYPIWNPREYNTGIELISLIDESDQ